MEPWLPQAPFDTWPRHLVVAPYGADRPERNFLWLDEASMTLVSSVQAQNMDLPVCRALVYSVNAVIAKRADVLRDRSVWAIHDWRRVDRFEAEGRKYQQAHANANLRGLRIEEQLVSIEVNPWLHMALSVASMIFAVATGTPFRLVKPRQFDEIVAERKLVPGPLADDLAGLQAEFDAIDYVETDPSPL